ncbi:hypothetical protein [Thioalkalivibrio thiocyanodenitrificans]|uniref:hypothetical protein n=1 Tax=Thioalkalivibrio thiocyanodenitrificans TaxID=243063 RepID=UPI00036BAAF5|nr:hypothetical protein [Thioalkalivibrio thiocyanodenitrificans]
MYHDDHFDAEHEQIPALTQALIEVSEAAACAKTHPQDIGPDTRLDELVLNTLNQGFDGALSEAMTSSTNIDAVELILESLNYWIGNRVLDERFSARLISLPAIVEPGSQAYAYSVAPYQISTPEGLMKGLRACGALGAGHRLMMLNHLVTQEALDQMLPSDQFQIVSQIVNTASNSPCELPDLFIPMSCPDEGERPPLAEFCHWIGVILIDREASEFEPFTNLTLARERPDLERWLTSVASEFEGQLGKIITFLPPAPFVEAQRNLHVAGSLEVLGSVIDSLEEYLYAPPADLKCLLTLHDGGEHSDMLVLHIYDEDLSRMMEFQWILRDESAEDAEAFIRAALRARGIENITFLDRYLGLTERIPLETVIAARNDDSCPAPKIH